jgi:hypothetical protein
MVLMNWTIDGEPRLSSSCAFTTSTGRAAFSGVPAMNEPVTITSLTSDPGGCGLSGRGLGVAKGNCNGQHGAGAEISRLHNVPPLREARRSSRRLKLAKTPFLRVRVTQREAEIAPAANNPVMVRLHCNRLKYIYVL